MKVKRMIAMGMVLLVAGLTACSSGESSTLAGVVFDRGHGSLWGNQFYVAVTAGETQEIRYIPQGQIELETFTGVAITPVKWQEICQAVDCLVLKEDRPSLWQRLFRTQKLDGGEYRTLILCWQTEQGIEEVFYLWSGDSNAQALEELLERLSLSCLASNEQATAAGSPWTASGKS